MSSNASKSILFLKSVQIYIKNAGCAETNEKSIFRFLRFSVFEIQNCQFSMSFHDNSKNKNRKIYFSFDSALLIFYENWSKTEVCISLIGTGLIGPMSATQYTCGYISNQ